MEKPKKNKEVKFNPADYEYMDKLPLEGWIWEFMRRSQAYKNLYSKIRDLITIERRGRIFKIFGQSENFPTYRGNS